MVDITTPEKRSRMMAGIQGKNTKPELIIRKALHQAGFRYRLHAKTLPGKPDLVFPKYSAVILINGCFWHGHDCHLFKWPSTRQEFWRDKITGNKDRDHRNLDQLQKMGWRVLEIWECALKGKEQLPMEEIVNFTSLWLVSSSPHAVLQVESGGLN